MAPPSSVLQALLPRQHGTNDDVTEEEAEAALAVHMQSTLRAMYVQAVIDTFLCAIVTVMIYTYWRFQLHDRRWTRALVVATTVMLYAVTIYLLWFVQYFFVQNFGEYVTFFETTHFAWFPILDAISATLAQGYVAHRAWRLNGRNWPLLGVCFLMLSFGGAVWTKIRLDSYDSLFAALTARRRRPMTLWLSAVMGANIILSAAVLRGLIKTWEQWAPNENWITRITRLTLESQLPSTAVSIAFLIQIRVRAGSLIGSTFYGIQSNIYFVGLLYSLNGRVRYAAGEVKGDTSDEPTTAPQATAQAAAVDSQLSHRTYATAPPLLSPYSTPYATPGAERSSRSSDARSVGDAVAFHPHAAPIGLGGRGGSDGWLQGDGEDKGDEAQHERQGSVGRSTVGSSDTVPRPLRR